MKKLFRNPLVTIGIVLTLALLGVSRFALLDRSARFIWDESDDLVRMHEIFQNHRITLVGPMSDNLNIYGSLSYYMLMPFAVFFHFDPIGPVIGTAVYSTITALLLAYILHKKLHWNIFLSILFSIILFPLVQSGRWAWNPHYIPLWEVLAIFLLLFLNRKRWYVWVLSGLILGLTIHNHWYAFFMIIGIAIAVGIYNWRNKQMKQTLYFYSGIFLAIVPFIIFDITHPPGLFITRLIYFSPISPEHGGFNLQTILTRIVTLPYFFLYYFFQNHIVTIIFIPFIAYYLYRICAFGTLIKKLLLIPIATQLFLLCFIGTDVFAHYYLPIVIFFVLLLAIPDEKKHFSQIQKLILILVFIGSIYPSTQEILKNDWSTNIKRTRTITNIIADNINGQKCNIFVPASKDPSTQGKKYRDLLSIRGVPIVSGNHYDQNDCLFIISTSSPDVVSKDQAYEVNRIRNLKPVEMWKVEDWNIYKYDLRS